MKEEITLVLKNGKEKTYSFDSWLDPNGIIAYVEENQFHCQEEKDFFEKGLKSERDVVKIKYLKNN